MPDVSILERPVFGVAEAADLLGLQTQRVRGWLDGYTRQRRTYPPVIRTYPSGSDLVTWGEYVELDYLRQYRGMDVSLQSLRGVIQHLREELKTPYPLASAQAFVYERELVWQVQQDAQLPSTLAIVVRTGQGLALGTTAARFLRKVEFEWVDSGAIVRLRPAGQTSPVVMDPTIRFGRPTIGGATTERLWELHDAGDTVEWIAESYGLQIHDVRAAIAFEEQHQLAAA